MEVVSLKAFFNSINYDYSIFKDNINTINKLTKTRSKDNNKPIDVTTKQIFDVLSNKEKNIEQFGLEQPFLIHAICKNYNAKNFLEIGTGRGTASYSVSLLDSVDKIDTIDIVSKTKKFNAAINFVEFKNLSLSTIYDYIPFDSKKKITFHNSNSLNFKYDILSETKYDVAFIDGCHNHYETIMNDFIKCKELIKENGIIVMDDYGTEKVVTRVINDIYKKYKNEFRFKIIEFRGHLFDEAKKQKKVGVVLIET